MRIIWAALGILVLLFVPSAHADSSWSCHAFLDHIMFKQGLESLDAVRRKDADVRDGGQRDYPFTYVDYKDPAHKKSFVLDTMSEGESGWMLKLSFKPAPLYVYHFQVRDHVCRLQYVKINDLSKKHDSKDCAASTDRNTKIACELGEAFFKTNFKTL